VSSVSVYGWAAGRSSSNVALSGLPVGGEAGDPWLLTEQTDATENGLWILSAGAWTRPANGDLFPGAMVYAASENAYWLLDADEVPAVGADAQTWVAAGIHADDGVVWPSGDTTGATDQAALEAAIATGHVSLQSGGVYWLSAPIPLVAGLVIDVIGATEPAVIRNGTAWSGTGEGPDNALFTAHSVDTATTTTLAATAPEGSESITVASSTGFAEGDHWRVGEHLAAGSFGMSNGADVQTHCVGRIDGIAGATWTEGLEHAHYLCAGMVVRRITGVVRGVRLRNLRFDAWDPTLARPMVATAIAASYAYDWDLEVEVAGFAAWAVDTIGCADMRGRIVSQGANAGVLKRRCAAGWRISIESGGLYRERTHPSRTYPIPAVFDRDDVRACVDSVDLSHLEVGVWTWGHYGCRTQIRLHDIDASAFTVAGSPPTGEAAAGCVGVGVHTNANAINLAVFGQDNEWDIDVWDCHTGSAYKFAADSSDIFNYFCSVYLHDLSSDVAKVRVRNRGVYGGGPPYGSASRYAFVALRIQDSFGRLDAEIQGYPVGCATSGVYSYYSGKIVLDGQPGTGLGTGDYAFLNIGDLPPQFDRVEVRNYSVLMSTYGLTSTFSAATYAAPFARSLVFAQGTVGYAEVGPVYWAKLPNGAAGTIAKGYTWDASVAAGIRALVTSSPAALSGVVLLSQGGIDPRNVLAVPAPGGTFVGTSGAAVALGQRVEFDASGNVVPLAAGVCVGVAQWKATGASQSVLVGGS
jgi:hypothetical protein